MESVLILLEQIAENPLKVIKINQKLLSYFTNIQIKYPILVIREIQALDNLNEDAEIGKDVFYRLFQHFQPRKQGNSRLPVIIETSDFLWSRVQQMSESRESFKPYLVKQFKKRRNKRYIS